jgi:hypothetical protein
VVLRRTGLADPRGDLAQDAQRPPQYKASPPTREAVISDPILIMLIGVYGVSLVTFIVLCILRPMHE